MEVLHRKKIEKDERGREKERKREGEKREREKEEKRSLRVMIRGISTAVVIPTSHI